MTPETILEHHRDVILSEFRRVGVPEDDRNSLLWFVCLEVARRGYEPVAVGARVVARSRAIDAVRRLSREPVLEPYESSSAGSAPELLAEHKESLECLSRLLETLPAKYRSALLHWSRGTRPKNVNWGTYRWRVHQAIKLAQELL